MNWTPRHGAVVAGLIALAVAGCGPGGEVRLVGEEIAQASSAQNASRAAPQPSPMPPSPMPPNAVPPYAVPPYSVPPNAMPPTGSGQPLYAPAPMPTAMAIEIVATATPPPAPTAQAWSGWPFVVQPVATDVPVVPTREPTWTPFPTATPPPTATPDALLNAGPPVQVDIPALGVTALVEQVGLTADGAMDTPKGWMNAAWFSKGFRPGEAGNAVIAGHLDSRSGGPAVFWSLNRLQPGDEVTVTYENGDRYTFAVQDIQTVPYDIEGEAVAAIFGPSQTSDLNLITCNGTWDRGKATYTQRLVVYTTLVPEKTVRGGYQGSYD